MLIKWLKILLHFCQNCKFCNLFDYFMCILHLNTKNDLSI